MALYALLLSAASRWGRSSRRPSQGTGLEILLTGTFYSENWIASHLRPLACSGKVARIRMVATSPVPTIDKVEAIYPSPALVRTVGEVPARLLTFLRTGIRFRPQIVGGFHLLVNGLAAVLLGKVIGAYTMYICVGGPREVQDGGVWTDNRIFRKLGAPDLRIERKLLKAVAAFDLVITMGKGAVRYFRSRGIDTRFHVISGGMDSSRYRPSGEAPSADLIIVCRLGPVKRIDRFLDVVRRVKETIPGVSAIVVGDGPLRSDLERMAADLGIGENVTFAGHQTDVGAWLRKARIFVLTSESEGLSLALMEAMLCGLPAVVPRVGDLEELVEDGVNGYLIEEKTADAFVRRIVDLLSDPDRLAGFSRAARSSSERYDTCAVGREWELVLSPYLAPESRCG